MKHFKLIKAALAVSLLSFSLSSQAMSIFDLFALAIGQDNVDQVQTVSDGNVSVYYYTSDSSDTLSVFGNYDTGSSQGTFEFDLQ